MRRFLIGFSSVILFSQLSSAQFFTGPIAEGAGGAGRAAADPSEVSFLNPAAIAHLQSYYVGLSYGLTDHRFEGGGDRMSAHLADGTPSNIINGALSYVRKNSDAPGPGSVAEQDLAVSIAGRPIRKVSLGLTVHRLMSSVNGSDEAQTNGHLGILFTPTENVGIGAVAYDVVPAPDSIPAAQRLIPTYAIATNFLISDRFHFRADLVRPDRQIGEFRNDVMVGLESYFREDFIFRLGSQWRETRDENYVTTGIGYKGPRLSFDYAFQKDVRSAEGHRHLIDLWLPL